MHKAMHTFYFPLKLPTTDDGHSHSLTCHARLDRADHRTVTHTHKKSEQLSLFSFFLSCVCTFLLLLLYFFLSGFVSFGYLYLFR